MKKYTFITQQNPRVLEDLCQDPGTKTKYFSYYTTYIDIYV